MALINIQTNGGLWGTIAGWINSNFTALEAADIQLGWKDNIQTFTASKGKGTSEPTWRDSGNGLYDYNFVAGDELFVKHHVDHDYALTTDAYPHVHFYTDTQLTVGQTVTWEYGYVIAKGHAQGDSLLAAQTIIQFTYTATGSEVVGDHIVTECSDLQAFDLLEPDAVISARVKLVSTTAAGRVYGVMSDIHYQSDVVNTVNKAPDFYN
jgi:hypothetical protein